MSLGTSASVVFAREISKWIGLGAAGSLVNALARFGVLSQSLKTYYVISTDPIIIYIGNRMSHLFDIGQLLRDRPVHFIRNSYHTFERKDRLERLVREVANFNKCFPLHRLYFLCPTEREQLMFDEVGLQPAFFVNKNAFVDETQFKPVPGVRKDFDAIYNGQLAPYKRHELASKVQNLALIVYQRAATKDMPERQTYAQLVRELLREAEWLNDVGSFIAPEKIPVHLSRARVGLCLSVEEGPMAASMEYLLCGLPVVSTRSLGGRDVFFDSNNSLIVEDCAEAVAAGVVEMVSRNLDPANIRASALEKIAVHRRRFIGVVEGILSASGKSRDFSSEFDAMFANKMRMSATFPGGLLKHVAEGMPADACRAIAQISNQ